ncbi:MAG TPA: hypothetical protein VIN08_05275 [Ohtaekwangia sp.]|uniref:hypothetical protein n=1 Tax=Ohtaekwangia sp. TaxID=2066019 RepID=UPI002F947862
MMTKEQTKTLYYILRIACAMCFIGHGAFGIITKQIWCNYFAVAGIDESLAYQLMPVVGIADIVLGLVLLFYPVRIAAAWLVFWGLLTASMRPLSGEPFAEFLERAGNYGAPLVLLILTGLQGISPNTRWFQKLEAPATLSKEHEKLVVITLQIIAFTLLFGHGWLNIIEKPALLKQYISFGVQSPETMAHFIGIVEIIGACSIVLWPARQIILILFIWKMLSETQYPAFPIFEWVERGGSYATLLALLFIVKNKDLAAQALSLKWRMAPHLKHQHQ